MRYTKRDGNYTGKERKLWELENEIEDGLLVKLPFKINQEVYFVFKNNIRTFFISGIVINNINPLNIVIDTSYYPRGENVPFKLPMCDYNKDWFTDRELAEKKLEELEK